jgi:hypothetical protein
MGGYTFPVGSAGIVRIAILGTVLYSAVVVLETERRAAFIMTILTTLVLAYAFLRLPTRR